MSRASVVIPAHNESRVILRGLTALLEATPPGALEVIVACNGCTDDTAERVRGSGLPVRVIEVDQASKIAALRAADAVAETFPRIYLDADVVLPGSSALVVADLLAAGEVLAARPPLVYDTAGASAPVRSYYRARSRVPEVLNALWGAGVYAVSETGHARIAPWPNVVADDLYVDRCFEPEEIRIARCAPVVVRVPLRSGRLVAVLGRTYTGKADPVPSQRSDRGTLAGSLRGLARLGLTRPRHGLDVAVYALFAVGGRVRRSRRTEAGGWVRDETSRVAV